MTEYNINFAAMDGDTFAEASPDELRVLLAIIALRGRVESMDKLAKRARTKKARTGASVVYWTEAGVIETVEKSDTPLGEACGAPTITEEFEERIALGKIVDTTAVHTAKSVRDNNLADLISECAALMGKPMLSTEEIKIINALYEQYGLDEEYIITLAAWIAEKGKLTAARLSIEAERLMKRDITNADALLEYINDKSNELGAEREFCRLVGIYNRRLSPIERDYVKKWYYDWGFGSDVVALAYSETATHTSKLDLRYLDAILTNWHELGCLTSEDCKRAMDNPKPPADEGDKKRPPRLPRSKKPEMRYGDFDVEDAFEKALLRSYGNDGADKAD